VAGGYALPPRAAPRMPWRQRKPRRCIPSQHLRAGCHRSRLSLRLGDHGELPKQDVGQARDGLQVAVKYLVATHFESSLRDVKPQSLRARAESALAQAVEPTPAIEYNARRAAGSRPRLHGGRSSIGGALDCGSRGYGFESRRPPHVLTKAAGSDLGGLSTSLIDFNIGAYASSQAANLADTCDRANSKRPTVAIQAPRRMPPHSSAKSHQLDTHPRRGTLGWDQSPMSRRTRAA
jgi:hypothetical protein